MVRVVGTLPLILILGASAFFYSPASVEAQSGGNNAGTAAGENSAHRESQKRALIVALNSYESSTGWWDIASDNDIPLIRGALQRQGFADANIQVIRNEKATKKGIVDAFTRLIDRSGKGDIVVFHFSGHGQQLTDDEDGEELDGFDEALVPYDAPLCPGEVYERGVCVPQNYHGQRHLRDDELNELLQRARLRVGPRGNVVVFLDSCFSGTGTRGRSNVRGAATPQGFPRVRQEGRDSPDQGGGFFDKTASASESAQGTGDEMAPFVVFSAARNNQLAYQTETDIGVEAGSLSFALSKALMSFGKGDSYRAVFDHVKWVMQSRVLNEPQIEGDKDSELFNGRAVSQVPYVEVEESEGAGRQVLLKAGSLVGMLAGSRIEFHRIGTYAPTPASKLGEGEVVNSSFFRATVELSGSTPRGRVVRSWAFVTRYAFAGLRLGVHIEKLSDPNLQQDLESTLAARVPALDSSVPRAETALVIREVPANAACAGPIVVEDARLGYAILGPLCAGRHDIPDEIGNRLVDYTRNQYLRKLWVRQGNLDVSYQVIPIELKTGCVPDARDNPLDCVQRELDPETFVSAGGQLQLPLGTYFKIRAHAPRGDAHITILDLVPDGTIGMLWPPPGTFDKTALKKGEDTDLPAIHQIAEPLGQEVFLLIATQEWVDFEPFLSRPSLKSRGQPTGNLGPFAPLFNDLSVRARARTVFPRGAITTQAVTVSVVP